MLVTGKGGVGKTTVAASIAKCAAAHGKRVLCAEMVGGGENARAEVTSALAQAFGRKELDDQPMDIAPNLRAVALSPSLGHQKFLRDVLPMRLLADTAMRSAAIRRFLSAAPTFPEMGVLYRLLELVRQTRRDGTFEHDLLVVDLPATGHALALAQIPASLLRVIPSGPIATAVREGLALLQDPMRTGAVVVTLPETLPVSEAIELCAGIEQNAIPLAQVFVNRVPYDPFTEEEREAVRTLLDGRPPTLGERTMERIDRSRVSLARLSKVVRVPIAPVQDVFLDGPKLTDEVALLMDSGERA